MEVNQELARRLLVEGAICICLEVPVGTEVGIDLKSWTTAEKFRGIKMIPPGIHFIHFSAKNNHGDSAPRAGFMYNFKKSEILVKRWDTEKQELVDDSSNLSETFRQNLKEIDRFLGVYPFNLYSKWKNLSSQITPQILNKLLPSCGVIHSALELSQLKESNADDSGVSSPKTKRCRRFFFGEENYEDLLPKLRAVEGTELRFSTIPEKWYPEGSSPSEITRHSLDSSYLLEQIIVQHDSKTDILGELQFAFLCFFVGFSLEAFEHWKKLLNILCSSEEVIPKYNDLYSEFLNILNLQVSEIQEDFLVDIVAGNNFVYKLLRKLFRSLHTSDIGGRLGSRAKRFQEVLTEKFMWDFSDVLEEDEEDRPVIVET
ncbi:UNVERIFIED_CONTAM: hypothetical protein PYX00_008307 [Menopon gallinae]|uniref:Protein AAR2 homolog n=1 Tax=Menopon gallinae TaxID=328185 RepID=A0AAW2HN72_9NEOP